MDSPLYRKRRYGVPVKRITIIDRDALYERQIKPKTLFPLLLEVASERLKELEEEGPTNHRNWIQRHREMTDIINLLNKERY